MNAIIRNLMLQNETEEEAVFLVRWVIKRNLRSILKRCITMI